jgi:DNA (cytosine-5)-methyltransferase 1
MTYHLKPIGRGNLWGYIVDDNGDYYRRYRQEAVVITTEKECFSIKANYEKSFWIMENKPKRLYNIYGEDKGTGFAGNVWDTQNVCPTLQTMEGGNRQPLIEEPNTCLIQPVDRDYNKKGEKREVHIEAKSDGISHTLRTNGETMVTEVYPCLTPGRQNKGQNGPRFRGDGEEMFTLTSQDIHGVAIKKDWLSQKGVDYICDPKRGMATDVNPSVAQPVTAKGQANWTGSFISPDIESLEKSTEIGSKEPTKINLTNGETITSDQKDKMNGLRIRKLTPRECWRLMGWDDESFDKAASVNSNSQLYKQAGNGIVVQVLEAIFKELL